MSKIGTWSTTAGNNNAAPPDGWPEGQAPSTVNDCARELMASIRTFAQTSQFFDHGFTPTFVTSTTFTIAGNQSSFLESAQQLKLFDNTTIYRSIATVSGSATSTTVILNSGTAITSSLSSFAIGIITTSNNALPYRISASAIIANSFLLGISEGAQDTGLVWQSDGIFDIIINGAQLGRFSPNLVQFSSTVAVQVGIGSVANPSLYFNASNADTGAYWVSANVLGWACAGVQEGRLASNGYTSRAFNVTSDTATKTDWTDIPTDLVTRLSNLKAGSYTKKKNGQRAVGVAAQDLQTVLPEVVSKVENNILVTNYGPAAMLGVVALCKRVEDLTTRLAKLEAKK